MEVAAERAARIQAPDVLKRYRTDRFSRPGAPSFETLRDVEQRFIDAVDDDRTWIVPSPLLPLGTHVVLGDLSQDWVVPTVRQNEVAADPTVALALEAAVARRDSSSRRTSDRARLATIQRVTRAQRYDSPLAFAHFSIFALVTAGRSQPGDRFDDEALPEHLDIYVRALESISTRIDLTLSVANSDAGRRLLDPLRHRWSTAVVVGEDRERVSAQKYYRRACFKIHAHIGGDRYEIADGGFTDWGERLLGDRHERMLISGAGLDRPALAIGNAEQR